MTSSRLLLRVLGPLLLAAALAGCNETKNPGYQGWVEADLVLCAPVVAREAAQQGIATAAHYAHLVVHGTLHLAGLDHEQERDALRMERREIAVLR